MAKTSENSTQNLTRSQLADVRGIGLNTAPNPTIGDVIAARFNRRDLLKGALGVAAIAATVEPARRSLAANQAQAATASRFAFDEVGRRQSTTSITSPRATTPTS